MDGTPRLSAVFMQPLKIENIIFIRVEAGVSVVSPLDNVGRNTRSDDSWSPWHSEFIPLGRYLCKFKRGLTPIFYMDGTPRLSAVFMQPLKIENIIFIRVEAGVSVVSPLDNVGRNTRSDDSWSPWHGEFIPLGRYLCKFKRGLTPIFRMFSFF
ncbi:MAG: hypothetical protein PHI97_31945 [Desulfobulbus sp.]|nr:hypothetical protein [Desulfobulbus sp.]